MISNEIFQSLSTVFRGPQKNSRALSDAEQFGKALSIIDDVAVGIILAELFDLAAGDFRVVCF